MNNDLLLALYAHDFGAFLKKFFGIVYPGKTLTHSWHIDAIAHVVNLLIAGQTYAQLISMPPRSLKSYIVSVALPAYLLGHDPGTKIIVSTYADELSEGLSADCLRLMESELYRRIFPRTILSKRTQRMIQTTSGGSRFATTIGGAVTGMGGHYIIVDDPLNASHAYSTPLRTAANNYFGQTLSSRADNPKTARFIVVMQRLHEDDLIGRLLAQGGWEHLRLQAKATEVAVIDLPGGHKHHVAEGDLLDPDRMDEAYLERQRQWMGSVNFEAQYQQNPAPEKGNQIKREWLHRYTTVPARQDGIVVQSWDTASKTGVANDYSVCTTWLLQDGISYLLDVWRGKEEFPDLRKRVDTLYHLHKPSHILMEDASSGQSLLPDLRAHTPYNVISVKSNRLSKPARVDAISGALESGKILFPNDAPWLAVFEHELLAFPGGRHDDQVDSLTQYVQWAMERGTSFFEADFNAVPVTMESMAHHILNIRMS